MADLNELFAATQQLAEKEIPEANAARRAFAQQSESLLRETMADLQTRAEEVSVHAQKESQVLDSLVQDIDTLQERQSSPLHALFEPLLQTVAPAQSIQGTMQRVNAGQMKLNVIRSRGKQRERAFTLRQATREAQLNVGKSKLAIEQGDVEGLQAQIAAQQQAINAERVARQESLGRLSPDELSLQVQKGNLTPWEKKEELIRRENLLTGVHLNRLAKQNGDILAAERGRQLWLEGQTVGDLEVLREQAQENGGQVVTQDGLQFDIKEIVARQDALNESLLRNPTGAAQLGTEALRFQSQMESTARMLGIPTLPSSKDGTPMDVALAIANDPNVPADIRAEAKQASDLMQAAGSGNYTQEATIAVMREATKAITTANERLMEQRAKTLPAEQQAAALEFYDPDGGGQILSGQNAVSAIASHLAFESDTGSNLHNIASNALRLQLSQTGLTVEDVKNDTDPVEQLARIVQNPQFKTEALTAIGATAFVEQLQETAIRVGNQEIAFAIGDPVSALYANGESANLDTHVLFQMLQAQGGDAWDKFRKALTQNAESYFREEMQPVGPKAHIQAAYNKALFENAPAVWYRQFVNNQIGNMVRPAQRRVGVLGATGDEFVGRPSGLSPNAHLFPGQQGVSGDVPATVTRAGEFGAQTFNRAVDFVGGIQIPSTQQIRETMQALDDSVFDVQSNTSIGAGFQNPQPFRPDMRAVRDKLQAADDAVFRPNR